MIRRSSGRRFPTAPGFSDPRPNPTRPTPYIYPKRVWRDFTDTLLLVKPGCSVPSRPGPVVSGLRRGSLLLVIRSDFDGAREPVTLEWEGRAIEVPPGNGPQLLKLPELDLE